MTLESAARPPQTHTTIDIKHHQTAAAGLHLPQRTCPCPCEGTATFSVDFPVLGRAPAAARVVGAAADRPAAAVEAQGRQTAPEREPWEPWGSHRCRCRNLRRGKDKAHLIAA